MSSLPSMQEYMSFVNQYHADTVRQKKAARTPDGRVMTVNAKGVEHKGMIYTVPGYDGKELSERALLKKPVVSKLTRWEKLNPAFTWRTYMRGRTIKM